MSLLGVYVHVPFCLSKCSYCGFNSCASRSISENAYVNALLSEIEHVSDKRFSDCKVLDTVCFGGGTQAYPEPVSGLADAGLLDLAHDTLKLTSRGILLSDEVFQQFF